MTPDFLQHVKTIPGSCSQSVKESHWKTWQCAQEILISASGAPVLITTLPVQQRAEVL